MSWNPYMEAHYMNTSYPYNSAGSFMEYFEGLTYEHVNFIFDGASQIQESVYPSMNANLYKFSLSQSGSSLYYDHSHAYEIHALGPQIDDYRRPLENSSTMTNVPTAAVSAEREGNENMGAQNDPEECKF
ncbi:E3 ubiquitin-protein ligase BIG BROTHER-like [Manihot esculenta]|uniref:E3 ubiquitin-protein ligase BIG BROTHER-like n=1 Tax=Manihot esculenta TaxID=3983 RepID=UPI001CC764E3|nr:E3 ubiquitin-protein ligase BIG BROTHER-like [Manihot esculenta]XP_043816424.1 E3 ubiquitin-protein ligase BIG BROTHER-like [Manihot esculenta]XP_043816425.1 E3 ubiquitin-protein ligase BIG BROTHER-like [Manihot esculenta]XP_043816426.1 E3 ubiquitin-protein ligase BIG BROTHER-like [Manihot esculenta]